MEKIESVEQTLRQLVLQYDPSSATTTTEDSTVELRTLILEEGEKQTTLLGDIKNRMALCNTEDTVDNSTLVLGTGAALFALSFAIFAAIAALVDDNFLGEIILSVRMRKHSALGEIF